MTSKFRACFILKQWLCNKLITTDGAPVLKVVKGDSESETCMQEEVTMTKM
jgi:hypothetical protein